MTQRPEQHFRMPRWVRVGLAIATLVTIAATAAWIRAEGFGGLRWLGVAACLVFLTGTLDSFLTRVSLSGDTLVIVKGFRCRRIARSEVDSVKWEWGSGVSLRLQDGSWVTLPDIGNSQSRANSIRAWLRRGGDSRK